MRMGMVGYLMCFRLGVILIGRACEPEDGRTYFQHFIRALRLGVWGYHLSTFGSCSHTDELGWLLGYLLHNANVFSRHFRSSTRSILSFAWWIDAASYRLRRRPAHVSLVEGG